MNFSIKTNTYRPTNIAPLLFVVGIIFFSFLGSTISMASQYNKVIIQHSATTGKIELNASTAKIQPKTSH